MLGKLPHVPRTASSRLLLVPCEDPDGDSAVFSNNVQPGALCPCKVVIGFEVEAEKKQPPQVCESPRSVLESPAALPSHDKQHTVARSPRSGLGNLLAAKRRSDEDVSAGYESISRSSVPVKVSATCDCCNGVVTRNPVKTGMPTEIWDYHFGGDARAYQGQVSQEDLKYEILDSDRSPLLVTGSGLHPKDEELGSDLNTPLKCQLPNLSVTSALKSDKETNANSTESKQALVSITFNSSTCSQGNVPPRDSIAKPTLAPDRTSLGHFVGTGALNSYMSSKNALQHSGIDVEDNSRRPIFVASSPYCPRSIAMNSSGFLKLCNSCGCFLRLGKDVFMYRGDQTFCSAECRYQKIVIDERESVKSHSR